jgi:SAM-dependent methyltransferase
MKKVKFYQAMDRLDKIRDFLGPRAAQGFLLDVGANFGHFLHAAKFEGWSVEGIEISEQAIKAAEEEYGLKIHKGELEKVEYPPGSFDAVTMWHVLEHALNPKLAVQKIGKWLKPGGILGVAIPNIESLASRTRGWRWRWLSPPVHQNHLSKRALVELCQDNALGPVKSYTRDNFGSKDVLYEYLTACVLPTNRVKSKVGVWLLRQMVGDERTKNELLFPWAWRLKSGTYLEWHAGHLLRAEPLRRLRSWTRFITLAMHPLMRLLWTFDLGAELEMYFRKSDGQRSSGEYRENVL